jgi:hypothetical protein
MPRVLRGVEHRLMDTTALGYPVSAPIGIAPTAMQKMAHEMGELATAKGKLLLLLRLTSFIYFFCLFSGIRRRNCLRIEYCSH